MRMNYISSLYYAHVYVCTSDVYMCIIGATKGLLTEYRHYNISILHAPT